MTPSPRGILQLDFDGTLAEADVSTGILGHFAAPEWHNRVNAASRELKGDPDSSALVETMIAGFAALAGDFEAYLRYARTHHPARPGLPELIETAERLRLECHVVSNGFQFYIQDYLRTAGVEGRVQVHTGSLSPVGGLVYLDPEGRATTRRFKLAWAQHFLAGHDLLVYVGDGSSDIAPASQATIVFARDSLLTGLPAHFAGTVRPFETLHDVARDLEALLSAP